MPDVPIQRATDGERDLPIFQELSERADAIRRRAHALFEERGREFGHELDDWLAAEREILGWPTAEMKENDAAFEVDVTLPGFDAADVEVTATPSEIVLHAVHHEEKTGEEGTSRWFEMSNNDVFRRVDFPRSIDEKSVTASFDDGILHVWAPKSGVAAKASDTPTNGKSRHEIEMQIVTEPMARKEELAGKA